MTVLRRQNAPLGVSLLIWRQGQEVQELVLQWNWRARSISNERHTSADDPKNQVYLDCSLQTAAANPDRRTIRQNNSWLIEDPFPFSNFQKSSDAWMSIFESCLKILCVVFQDSFVGSLNSNMALRWLSFFSRLLSSFSLSFSIYLTLCITKFDHQLEWNQNIP
jgi:hypothetical protein